MTLKAMLCGKIRWLEIFKLRINIITHSKITKTRGYIYSTTIVLVYSHVLEMKVERGAVISAISYDIYRQHFSNNIIQNTNIRLRSYRYRGRVATKWYRNSKK
ncbi:hypothetical protein PR048_016359 [Dryococelus australis]|uniref:Uncharacterized protein n=1 Tax=Dryococelus australis TaxID=614101 RepID=A0ABQ9HJH6_9NEOP|nr:hypothetical protein PR048_016359 [Dryococelus australis]